MHQARFVGRQHELSILQASLAEARGGRGGLVLIVGEAGIGKTALARAFVDRAQEQGALILWGGCFEGDWQPPYGPWIEALGQYARSLDDPSLRRVLGANAATLARLIPDVPLRWPDLPPVAALRPEEERFRLSDAVARWLATIGRDSTVILVLDDLHWADPDSLWLLRQIVRTIERVPLLIVATHRDPDIDFDRQGALGEFLAMLRREGNATRLPLAGLEREQVAAYLGATAGQDLPGGLVRAIETETAGNPFYLRETLRHLIEEGTIARRAGRWSAETNLNDLGIPEGVRAVLNRRLLRLGEATNRLLRLAAGFTGGFSFQTIHALTGDDEDAVLDSLDEALRAGLLRVTSDQPPATYDFAHAIVRHTLYAALNPDRKARLHRRIAEALAGSHGDRAMAFAADLAAQYHASRALPGAERGIPYALAAATAARSSYAHERAVTYLRMARDLVGDTDAGMRSDILQRLAVAEAEALQLAEARRTADEALALAAEQASDPQQAAFLVTIARALKEGGAAKAHWERFVERGLALIGDRRDLTWARLALLRERLEPLAAGPQHVVQWHGYDPQAIAIAREIGDEEDYAHTLESFDWRSRAEVDNLLVRIGGWQRPTAIIWALNVAVRDLIYRHGDLPAAITALGDLLERSRRYGAIPSEAEALVQLGLSQAILGDYRQAQAARQWASELVAQLGIDHRLRFAIDAVGSTSAYFYAGDGAGGWATLAAAVGEVGTNAAGRGLSGLTATAFASYNYLRAGDEATARRLLAAITPVFDRIARTTYVYGGSLDRIVAAIWELEAVEYAARYRALTEELIALHLGDGPLKTFELMAARLAALLGDGPAAATYFAQARVVLDTAGHRPMRAIVDYDEALALTRHLPAHASRRRNREQAEGLLDAALAQFRALDMVGWESRALALRADLAREYGPEQRASAPPPWPAGLTRREAEVLRLVAHGHTNREIAAALFVSVPTVQRHIANIYAKIGTHGRAAATAYALRNGLLADATG